MQSDFAPVHVFRRLFQLSAPVIGLNVLGVLALAVDTAMCGQLPYAADALAALGFATQVIFLLMVAMMGLTIGTVALVARAHGAGDRTRVDHILTQSTQLTLLLSIGVAILGNLIASPILGLLGADGEVLTLGVSYLRPMLTGAVFSYLNIMYAAVLRGVGNTSLAFFIALVVNGLNVVLNLGFILGHFGFPKLGVMGAGLGTIIAQAIGVFAMVVLLRRGVIRDLSLSLKPQRIDPELARELIAVGTPAAADMIIINLAFMSIVGMLGRLGDVAVAAHGVGLRVQALAFVPGLSISQATSAMVGQALGRGGRDEAKSVVRASLVLCTLVMTTLGALCIFFSGPIISLFSVEQSDPIFSLAQTWIHVLGYGMPIVGFHIAFVGMLRGAGATNTGLRINLIATAMQIPLSFVLGFPLGLGAPGVWAAFPFAFLVRTVFEYNVYRRGDWTTTGKHIRRAG